MHRRKKPEDLTPAEAQASALRLLARREHSAAQLRRKLASRGHDRESAGEVVEQLTQAGWQSDARFAEALALARAEQGFGPRRIVAELEASGVPGAQIRSAMESLDFDFRAQAQRMQRKHFGEVPARRGADWQKQYRYLVGRGFDGEQIRAALSDAPDPD